jgi:hypothetical protein
MIDLLQQQEAVPAAYPDAPSGLTAEAEALDADMIWARIEAYTAHRYTVREIVWTISGFAGDEWTPPIGPVVSQTAERWDGEAWGEVTLLAGPLGLCLPSDGTFKVTAQVGDGDVPVAVSEAFRRLAEYMADDPGRVGTTSFTDKIGPLEESITRAPTWLARAMQYSGAGDLLRNYRRA